MTFGQKHPLKTEIDDFTHQKHEAPSSEISSTDREYSRSSLKASKGHCTPDPTQAQYFPFSHPPCPEAYPYVLPCCGCCCALPAPYPLPLLLLPPPVPYPGSATYRFAIFPLSSPVPAMGLSSYGEYPGGPSCLPSCGGSPGDGVGDAWGEYCMRGSNGVVPLCGPPMGGGARP